MIDIIFLAHNRLEFTKASLAALLANTNWDRVARLMIYDDSSSDGTREYVRNFDYGELGSKVEFKFTEYYSPVAVMIDYQVNRNPAEVFAKIDSDTMLPAGWLESCLDVMEKDPELDLLGIEAFRPVQSGQVDRIADRADFIGGIGLMRSRVFRDGLPNASGRQGWTQFQERHPEFNKGWLNPALPVFLLDWIPREPWRSLTAEYVLQGWNRDWHEIFPELCPYPEERKDLWGWWCE